MKTIFNILAVLVINIIFVQAQTEVDLDAPFNGYQPNTYYKDTQNKLNQFEGIWLYDDGIHYIKFELVKKYQMPIENYFEDYLVGEFQYKLNGVQIINTFNKLFLNYSDPYDYSIKGNNFLYSHTPFDDFTTDNFRLQVGFNENSCFSYIDIRTLTLNGQQAMQIFKRKPLDFGQACNPAIPGGFYYLIKQ